LESVQFRVSLTQAPNSAWSDRPQTQALLQLSESSLFASSQTSAPPTAPSPQKEVAPATLWQLASQTEHARSP